MRKLIFAAVLPVVMLASCQNQGKGNAGAAETVTEVKRVEHTAGQIVYVHTDSLLMEYGMAKDLMKEFRVKYEKAENEIRTKQQKFERDYLDWQNKAQKALATRSQLEEMGQNLQIQEYQLQQDAEKLMGELAEEERVMNNRVSDAVIEFLKEYNADYKYGMIISTTAGGPILNADPALSITADVLKGLNAKYEKEKTAKK